MTERKVILLPPVGVPQLVSVPFLGFFPDIQHCRFCQKQITGSGAKMSSPFFFYPSCDSEDSEDQIHPINPYSRLLDGAKTPKHCIKGDIYCCKQEGNFTENEFHMMLEQWA